MGRNAPFDWSIHISVDGRTIKRGILAHVATGTSDHTISTMNFMEGGIAYAGKLQFASLVSLVMLT